MKKPRLTRLQKKPLRGDDSGVMINAVQEYGATPEELDAFAQKANQELDADRKARRLKPFTGKLRRS
jgi:hypothetical protein